MNTLFDAKDEVPVSTELVERDTRTVELTPMLLMQRLIDSGRDPGEMLTVYERWEANAAADAFGVALSAFQAKCPQILKTRQIDLGGGKGPLYASYDDIDAQIRPLMAECGLTKTFSASITEAGQMKVVCTIRHGRHTESSEVTLPAPAQMRVNDTQKMGAAMKYGMRYALCAALDIVVTDEDRDGEGLAETLSEEHIATLREWIADTESNEAGFLKFMGVKSLADIPIGDFGKALDALKRKAKR